jgi:hypothetical protein
MVDVDVVVVVVVLVPVVVALMMVVVTLMVVVVALVLVVWLCLWWWSVIVAFTHKQWCMGISTCTQTLANGPCTPTQYINPPMFVHLSLGTPQC